MKKQSLPIRLWTAGALLMLALVACAPNGAATTGSSQTNATATPGATATSTQPGGSSGTLPSDIPVYPSAHFLRAGTQGNETFYFYMSPDTPAKIFQFYQQQLPKNGWTRSNQPMPTNDPLGVYTKGQRKVMFEFTLTGAPVSGHPLPTAFSIIVSG